MKYSVKLTRENGKTVTLAANKYIDIDVNAGNRRIAALRLVNDAIRNVMGRDILNDEIEPRACENHAYYRASCTECVESNN